MNNATRRVFLRSMWLLAICLAVSGCARRDPSATSAAHLPQVDGHQRMVDELERIRQRALSDNPYFGDRTLRGLEQTLAERDPHRSSVELSQLHGLLGEELLKAGRTAEAVKQMQAALASLPEGSEFDSMRQVVHYRLGVAWLRLGENANCVHCTGGQSCLLPIQGSGIHQDREGSLQAIEHLLVVLEHDPNHLGARWLLNVAHMTLGSYPQGVPVRHLIPPEAFEDQATDIEPFTNVALALGLDTRNAAGSVVIDDFDGDGALDLITCSWDPGEPLRMFRNNGDGTFEERIESAGLAGIFGGLNLIQADYDNDGDVDLLVLRGAWLEREGCLPNSLLQNDGRGYFRDVTFESGLGDVHYPTQTAAWADFDLDGDLDLYIGNELFPCQLFENDGQGKFRDVAASAGVQNLRLTKGVAWGDVNGDRWPDLYVSNLPGENRLYINNRDGTFTDRALELGVARPLYSFPVWFWDFDNDGLLDLYVASFQPGIHHVAAEALGRKSKSEGDCLYRGLPEGGFREVSADVGLTRVTQPMGSNFGDLNNNGFLDIYLGTGYVDYEGLMPNLLFINREGRRFDHATYSARVGHLQKGHGIALGDLDHDGDLDIFAQMGGWFTGDAFPNVLFENPGSSGNWIGVRLVGTRSNRSAIGAHIRVVPRGSDVPREIHRWVNSGSSFGANPLRQHIGLGPATEIETLAVYWPATDETQTFHNVSVNQWIEITEGSSQFQRMHLERVSFSQPR